MPITGLVLTLAADGPAADAAAATLAAHPALLLGGREGARLAAAADTPSLEADRDLFAWMRDLPGVEHVDVVWAWIDDTPAA